MDYIKNLIFEYKLKKLINEMLINYGQGKSSCKGICYILKIKYSIELDYNLRKFKNKFKYINNDHLKDELLDYYNNLIMFIWYNQKNYFYDPDEPLKIL